ncbi:hypothetical protein MGYG_04087 [Nannizzia gypsea CBS 118893]|uniref:ATP-grasp domain-containing protein n=1 Tax=Arthroderma gypseum (strain ATCC MYA-4604 / CBS 118893) TaxID=535722 RepID=E4UUW7_ARTGP|nr:hypothetical protein MGYG_04087 [Nannizzia gypsea CBS 118893]EFR01084.1 hypothetical protein MGYG_04087 [Nannizzia gypsea CBS 118893]
MAMKIELVATLGAEKCHFECSWDGQRHSVSESSYVDSVDITVRCTKLPGGLWSEASSKGQRPQISVVIPSSGDLEKITIEMFRDSGNAALNFLSSSLKSCVSAPKDHHQALRLLIPRREGFILRSDIFNLRLLDCPFVTSIASFCEPNRRFTHHSRDSLLSSSCQLTGLFAASCAGILLEPCCNVESTFKTLDQELENRLSFSWLMKAERSARTIAIVEGGKSPETGRNLYMAAKALNISVVVLDKPGHWLEGPEYADWRAAFLPVDRNPNAGFPDRIVEALDRYSREKAALKIDGLVTFFDPLFVGVAAAAKKLGLTTTSPEAYAIATDKFKTSIAEGRPAYRASSPDEVAKIIQDTTLNYPLIVKPCSGWGSEGVFRVDNLAELKEAVHKIDYDRHGNDVVIEEYCNGPEVDANFILVDGKVVFFEASDDFPKDADGEGDTALKTFIETANILPSALPDSETEVLKSSLHQSLVRLGFNDGFFHLEARMKESRMEFRKDESSGLVDLRPKKTSVKLAATPEAWLIEINPRPPGVQALLASAHVYGVDYIGVSLCFALQDKAAAANLAVPFGHGKVGNGAQYWSAIVFIPVVKGGIFGSDDVCADLRKRRPDLTRHVSRSHCFFQRGDTVKDPSSGLLNWIAYYLVFSYESRAHVLGLAEDIRTETKFEVAQP